MLNSQFQLSENYNDNIQIPDNNYLIKTIVKLESTFGYKTKLMLYYKNNTIKLFENENIFKAGKQAQVSNYSIIKLSLYEYSRINKFQTILNTKDYHIFHNLNEFTIELKDPKKKNYKFYLSSRDNTLVRLNSII